MAAGPGPESLGDSPHRAGVPLASGGHGSGSRRVRALPGSAARAARDAEVWLAGAPGAAGSTGTGRGAELGWCAGALGPQLHSGRPAARGTHVRQTFSPPSPAEIGGGGRGRGCGQALFVSFHFPRQPLERRTAGLGRSGPGTPGSDSRPFGISRTPHCSQGPGHACAVRGGRPDFAS